MKKNTKKYVLPEKATYNEYKSEISSDDVAKAYKRYAPFYDWIFGRILQPGRKAIALEVNALNPQNLLEIGVGTGLMLPMYHEHIPVTGIDISKDMLNKAMKRVHPERVTKIELLKIDGENLPFADNTFACVVLPYTYSVTPDPKKLISEVRRVCKNDGLIVIVNHFSEFKSKWNFLESMMKPFAKKIGFKADFSYRDYVENVDWEILKIYSVNLMNLSKVIIIKNQSL